MERIHQLSSPVKNLQRWSQDARVVSQLAVFACLVVLAGGFVYFVRAYVRAGKYWLANTDYRVFYDAAVAIRHHVDPFTATIAWTQQYSPHHHLGVAFATKSFVYPPIFAILQTPFTWLSPLHAAIIWDLCNVFFLLGALYALLQIVGIRPSLTGMLIVGTAAVLTDPVRKELFVAQADIFILFLVCMAFWANLVRRSYLSGILLGVACSIKPQLLLWLVFLLWKREFRFAASALLCFLVLFLTPFLWLGGHTWHDQLTIFQFWSNQYLAYDHNDSPKGVLARLFTQNPVVRPILAAPILVTVLWFATVAVILTLAMARLSPRPLQCDTRSRLELGLWVTTALLISPLTEWPYLLVLAIPLLTLYAWLRPLKWSARPYRIVTFGSVSIAIALCGPLTRIENLFVTKFGTHSIVADFYVLLAPGYLYALIAMFALQLYSLRLESGELTTIAVRRFLVRLPLFGRIWIKSAGHPTRS